MKYKELLTWLKENGYIDSLNIDVVLRKFFNDYLKLRDPNSIIKIIGELEGLPENYATIKSRKKEIVAGRYMAMTLIKCNTKLNLSDIGWFFNKDRVTVTHAHKTIDNLIETNKNFELKFNSYLKYFNLEYEKHDKSH